jgi:hypothetical protein
MATASSKKWRRSARAELSWPPAPYTAHSGVCWRGRIGKRYSIPGAILDALAILAVIGDFYRILEIDPDAGFFAATDVGIYVTLIGAILALVGALYHTSMDQERQGTTLLSSSM